MTYQKPIPLKNEDNKPYWDAADEHKLMLQKCNDCGTHAHPPGPTCAKCGSDNMLWEDFGSDVTATIYSYIITYRPFLPGFEDDLPTIIALGKLDKVPEVKIMCNVRNCSHEDIKVDMPVKMIWEKINENRALPQWSAIG